MATSLKQSMAALADTVSSASILATSMALETEDVSYTKSNRYEWYDTYVDSDYSSIDSLKVIRVNPSQINITQEENSQVIPFQMPRYWDGVDLMTKTLRIHFVNMNNGDGFSSPINVSYSEDKIRFYWLVDSNVTAYAGRIAFEIQATGTENGKPYTWRTRPNRDELTVLEALAGDGLIEPSTEWYTQFIRDMDEKVATAESASKMAQELLEKVNSSITELQGTVENAKEELSAVVTDTITEQLLNYYTKDDVDQIIKNLDFSSIIEEVQSKIDSIDGLAALSITRDENNNLHFLNGDQEITSISLTTDPTSEWTGNFRQSIGGDIETAKKTVQESLDFYKAANDKAVNELKTAVADRYTKEDVTGLLADKATKAEVTEAKNAATTAASKADVNAKNITTLTDKAGEIETQFTELKDNFTPKEYYFTYDSDYYLSLWEVQGENETEKSRARIVGGGGGGTGGGASSTVKIERVTSSPLVVTKADKAIIKYTFSSVDGTGDDTGEGSAVWQVDGTAVATSIALQGENSFDITKYVSTGTHRINLKITDSVGNLTAKTWTVQVVDVYLESTFNDKLTYPIGTVSFDYTPYGAIDKTIHFKLDDQELTSVNTSSSGLPMSYTLPVQTHGSHLLEVYATAEINGSTIETEHLYKDIIWYDEGASDPVIGCTYKEVNVQQYDSLNIQYVVYDPSTESPKVTLAVDGKVISNLTVDNTVQTWQFKSNVIGPHTLTITCGSVVKTISATVTKLDIDLEPVTANLAFDFDPSGRSNADADRLWTDGTVSMTVSDNFDWTNGGYQIDENGDQFFRVIAGSTATFDYKLFADDAKRSGKEFKVVFMTENVRKANANFLSCDSENVGLRMNVHEAYIDASAGSLYLPYSEEDIIEFEFNISKATDQIPMVMGYEDGCATRPLVYNDSHNFTQNDAKVITVGSSDCDVRIYRMKAYSSSLTDRGILNNFIADARNADEMVNRYTRNQIYDENNALTPETLAQKCPNLRILKLDVSYFTNNKSDKVVGGTLQQIYKNGDPQYDNWTAYNIVHNGQGTTSNEYGAAGRNLEFNIKEEGAYFVLGDGETQTDKVSLTRTSVPNNYMNLKVNIASSENENNALLQRMFNEYDPYTTVAKQNNPFVKDSMEFQNAVLFVRESNEDLTTHREFQDTSWHYYALGNIGDSKKTDKTRLTDKNDRLEHVVEIMDNTLPNSLFGGDPASLAALEADKFDEKGTYGFRYIADKTDADLKQQCINIWKEFYKFVATSSDEEFKAKLADYFVVDTALFHYLFTTYFTGIDNRAKNTFWHYSKCADGKYRYDLAWAYDWDSCLGINNSGELTMTYGYEDTDYKTKGDASTGYAYNAAESKFFCRIRDLFTEELQRMYVTCESAGAWNAEVIINRFDEAQSEFPEELWRIDFDRKYLRSFRDGSPRFLNTMMQGKKKYQRRQFLRNQEKYMATKYFGNTAVADQIMFRCNTPTDKNIAVKPDYTLHLTPYADMYLDVMFGATYRTQIRAEAGKQYDIKCPFSTMDDTAVLIYCASMIQSIADISACYIHDNDFSKATKLQELIIGNSAAGYQNNFLTQLGIGNNTLLEKLDIRNTPELKQALDLSKCKNLLELDATGSGLTGVTFANGGKIRSAKLPAIQSMTAKNINFMTDLDVASYDNLTTLVVENSPVIDAKAIINSADNLNRLRVIGINWELPDTKLTDRIYGMFGIDASGYNITQSVLAGDVNVPVMKEQKLADYNKVWSDLNVTYNTLVAQFAITFVNDDDTVLEVQYVDKGSRPVDPLTRAENPMDTPVKESDQQYDYTFEAWGTELVPAFSPYTVKATYTSSIREYTAKFVSMGTVMQEEKVPYGSTVFYTKDLPTYTAEESAYRYYLFDHWDKSGYVTGDITINAVYDICEFSTDYFDGKDLSELKPVEIYAMTKVGRESQFVAVGDSIKFNMGNDFSFDDIEEKVFIDKETVFTGKNYIDTGVSLINEDKDWVFAVDYEFGDGNVNGNTLLQCYKSDGSVGFKIWTGNMTQLTWGTSSTGISNIRNVLVLRHIKGENKIHVYNSALPSLTVATEELNTQRKTEINSTLVFGCVKADDGAFENYGKGTIYWAKAWYADLGDEACKKLAAWSHETINMQVSGFKQYYYSDGSGRRSAMSFLASNLLANQVPLNANNSNNAGGFGSTSLYTLLNNRFYEAIPTQWRQLIKQVKVNANAGNGTTDIVTSNCYVAVPSVYELSSSMNFEPYNYEGSPIAFINSSTDRIRKFADGTAHSYWTRSADKEYTYYYWYVQESGDISTYQYGNYSNGILIIFSI